MIVARNILLAELTGARVHCQHLSAAGSVARLREAKETRRWPVSGEACAHHFTLTDAAVGRQRKILGQRRENSGWFQDELPEWPAYDTNFKMNPPLRTARRPRGGFGGLADGTMKFCAATTRHTCDYEKEVEFDYAPFGIIGLENRTRTGAHAAGFTPDIFRSRI